jgi:hypothetical protein
MEVYALTISFPFDDDEPWSKTIEVKEKFALPKINKLIKKVVDYDDDHLYEFK